MGPMLTMWQVMFDLLAAGSVPPGYGHLFQSGEYLVAWAGITHHPAVPIRKPKHFCEC